MVATLTTLPPNVITREPRGAALDLLYDRSPELLVEGPGGTGKTLGVLTKIHICLAKYPGSRALMVRKTRESQTESNLVELEDRVFIGPAEKLKRGPDRAHRQRYTYPNRSTWVIGGMNKASRIMSTQYDIIYVPEATELTQDDWEDLSTRNRHGVMPYQQMIADCNPGPASHWLNLRANAGLMTRLLSRHEDNPKWYDAARGEWTPEGRLYVLGTLERLSGARKQRMRYGKWATAEGVIYDGYDPETHLIDRFDIPADWQRFRVVDFGFTNPFVTQWWTIDPDGRMYRYRELYRTQRLVSDHAEDIKRLSTGETYTATVADHDAEDRATLHAAGIPTVPAFKAVGTGIQAVQARLAPAGDGRPRLYFLRDSLVGRDERLVEAKKPLCTEQEIDGYVWEKAADGRPIKESPVKVDDHGVDCTRYAVAYADGLGVRRAWAV
jgi:PBSX family phage terminase large subunit